VSDWILPDVLRNQVPLCQQTRTFHAAGSAARQLPDVTVFLPDSDQPPWARRIALYERDRFRRECEAWSATATFQAAESGAGRRAVNWNYALRFPDAYLIQQITGNCVFASLGDVGITTLLAYLIFARQQPIAWEGVGGSAFYCFRGHSGQGASLSSAAAAHNRHGYPLRRVYCGGKYDLRDTRADQQFGIDHWRNQPADFLAETSRVKIGRVAELDAQTEAEAQQLVMDCLFAGGIVHTGSTSTAAKDGDPVSSGARIGAHAQICIGYDDTPEFRDRYRAASGKTLTEPVYFFDQTHGPVQYVRSGWMADLHGRQTQGMFVLPWRHARNLILSTCYLYWPDLTGTPAAPLVWSESGIHSARAHAAPERNSFRSTVSRKTLSRLLPIDRQEDARWIPRRSYR
jgi:hypothetical protein